MGSEEADVVDWGLDPDVGDVEGFEPEELEPEKLEPEELEPEELELEDVFEILTDALRKLPDGSDTVDPFRTIEK